MSVSPASEMERALELATECLEARGPELTACVEEICRALLSAHTALEAVRAHVGGIHTDANACEGCGCMMMPTELLARIQAEALEAVRAERDDARLTLRAALHPSPDSGQLLIVARSPEARFMVTLPYPRDSIYVEADADGLPKLTPAARAALQPGVPAP